MKHADAKKLKIGDRVEIWSGTENACCGSVIETGYCAVKFKWDDGLVGTIHLDDMANVVRTNTAAPRGPGGAHDAA